MSEVYRVFAGDWAHCLAFGDEMLVELFNAESYCTRVSSDNGFAHGKKMLNLCVTMWLEDIEKGLLSVRELYEDEKFPHWWLDRIFKTQ